MTKEIVPQDISIPDVWAEKFDLVVKECSNALAVGANTIKDSLIVMNGIRSMKRFFELPDVKELILMSQDNRAGFLTDRNEKAIWKHNNNPKKKYELKPYTYTQIVDALLPLMLQGYRPHGNEINIISGNGMPVKNGKYRRITEMTDSYADSISTPAIKDGHAFIKCRAKWQVDGQTQTIGYDEGDEVHIKIKFGQWDSIDRVIGLAESKLWTRVLRRITGGFVADEPEGGGVNITDEAEEATPAPKKKKPAPKKKQAEKTGQPVEQAPPPDADTEFFQEQTSEIEQLRAMVASGDYVDAIKQLLSKGTLQPGEIEETLESEDDMDVNQLILMLKTNK